MSIYQDFFTPEMAEIILPAPVLGKTEHRRKQDSSFEIGNKE